MPTLRVKATGALEDIPASAIPDALATGLYEPPGADVVVPVKVGGHVGQVTGSDLAAVQDIQRATPETAGQFRARETAARIEREHGGLLGGAGAFVEGVADAATLGGYGLATDVIYGDDYTADRRERAEANPLAAGAGTLAGVVAPAILSGGTGLAGSIARATPAGAASALGARIAGAGTAGAHAIGFATEGALYEAGHVLSETILQDKELSAEAFLAGAAQGAALGGVGGLGVSLFSRGARAAKKSMDSMASSRAIQSLEAEERVAAREVEKATKAAEKARFAAARAVASLEREEAQGLRAAARASAAESKAAERAVAKAEAAAAAAKARAEKAAEALEVERQKYETAKLVMDGRLKLSETYTAGWRRAAESREVASAANIVSTDIAADAKIRTGLSSALAKSGREDAGYLIEELIPAKMRSQAAMESAEGEVRNAATMLAAQIDDLVRQADELMAVNPMAAAELRSARDKAAEAAPAARDWAERVPSAAPETAVAAAPAANAAPARAFTEIAPDDAPELARKLHEGLNLTESEADTIRIYHRERESYNLNEKLRKGSALDSDDQALVADLDAALSKPENRLSQDLVMYRGIRRGAPFPSVGDEITDKSYQFATLQKSDAGRYAGKDESWNLEIEVPAGAPVISLGQAESATLLPREAKLKVISADPATRVARARMEIPGDEGTVAATPAVEAGPGHTLEAFDLGGVQASIRGEATPTSFQVRVSIPRDQVPPGFPLPSGTRDPIIGNAELIFQGDGLYPRTVSVMPEFQRKGVASRMYKMAEAQTGKKVVPAASQTDEGAAFSSSYRTRRDAAASPPAPPADPAFVRDMDTLTRAEEAHYELAQAMRPYLDDVSGGALDEAVRPMDDAIAKQDEIVEGAITRQAEARVGDSVTPSEITLPPSPVDDIGPIQGTSEIAPPAPGPLPRMPDMPSVAGPETGSKFPAVRNREVGTATVGLFDLAAAAGGLPNANDIPVIGPIVGTYLKYRAIRGALGRIGFRVGGPVARIARGAAQTQDRIQDAVGSLVRGADKAAPALARSVTPTSTALATPLWDLKPEERPVRRAGEAPKTDRRDLKELKNFNKRADELRLIADDPAAAEAELAETIPAPPALAAAIAKAVVGRLTWLAGLLPDEPPPTVAAPRGPRPVSQADMDTLATGIAATADPVGYILGAAARGAVSPVAVDAVQAVYPRLYQAMVAEVVEQVSNAKEPVPYDRLNALSTVFGIPLDRTTSPEYVAARQNEWAMASQAQQPPAGGPQMKLSQQNQIGAVGRAMR